MTIDGYSLWEVALAALIVLLAAYEVLAQGLARRRGLTRNVSRLASHLAVALLALAYVVMTLLTSPAMQADTSLGASPPPTVNWPYMVLAVLITVVCSFEVFSHLRARRLGRTRNSTRLVTRLAILLLVAVMARINVVKWDLYLERLEGIYAASIQPAEGTDPPHDPPTP